MSHTLKIVKVYLPIRKFSLFLSVETVLTAQVSVSIANREQSEFPDPRKFRDSLPDNFLNRPTPDQYSEVFKSFMRFYTGLIIPDEYIPDSLQYGTVKSARDGPGRTRNGFSNAMMGFNNAAKDSSNELLREQDGLSNAVK